MVCNSVSSLCVLLEHFVIDSGTAIYGSVMNVKIFSAVCVLSVTVTYFNILNDV